MPRLFSNDRYLLEKEHEIHASGKKIRRSNDRQNRWQYAPIQFSRFFVHELASDVSKTPFKGRRLSIVRPEKTLSLSLYLSGSMKTIACVHDFDLVIMKVSSQQPTLKIDFSISSVSESSVNNARTFTVT